MTGPDSPLGRPTRRRVLAGSAALLAAGGVGVSPAHATSRSDLRPGDRDVASRAAGSSGRQPVTLDGIDSFVEERMAETVDDGAVVGATAAVVRSDETVLAEGHGDARLEGEPVDENTRFRVGSLSKPIVWTAAMQLIEAGEIDPHADVESYLESVSIADTYDEPITMAHLATHTAGFEPRNQGLWVRDPGDVRPLPTVLAQEQPARVRPPGEVAVYSNYGAALAGQVVADVVSRPLDEYLRESVLDPLGMETATFEQPLPEDTAAGYTAALGTPTPVPYQYLEIWPAGSLTASATDMARFMRATLAGGSIDGEQALAADGIERMREQWFTHHPALDGAGFGWIEETRGDVRILWHNGAIPGTFYSHLVLAPDADVGLFLAYNTDVGSSAARALVDDFVAEYLSPPPPPSREPDGRPDRADALEGTYRGLRASETTHSRLISTLQAGSVTVRLDDDGYLLTGGNENPTRWVEREPLVFDRVDGHETLAFEASGDDVSNLYVGWQAFTRRSWHESPSLHGTLGAGSGLGMLSGVVGWPALRGWRYLRGGGEPDESVRDDADDAGAESSEAALDAESDGGAAVVERDADPPETDDGAGTDTDPGHSAPDAGFGGLLDTLGTPRIARWTIAGSALAVLAFVLGFGGGVAFDLTFLSDPPTWYRVLLVLPVLATIGTVVSLVAGVLAWRAGRWRRRSLLHFGIVAAATAIACWQLYYWNLYGVPG